MAIATAGSQPFQEVARRLAVAPLPEDEYLGTVADGPFSRLGRLAAGRRLLSVGAAERSQLSLFSQLSGLDFIRTRPEDVSVLLTNPWARSGTYSGALAWHGLSVARALFEQARELLADGRVDRGVAFHRQSRLEWGRMLPVAGRSDGLLAEALGKMAVSSAAIGRWAGLEGVEIERAIRYMEASIDLGNDGTEAHRYLSELHEQHFHATGDSDSIDRACDVSESINDHVASARCRLLQAVDLGDRNAMFARVRDIEATRPVSAVEFVQRDLLSMLVKRCVTGEVEAQELDLFIPHGTSQSLRRMTPDRGQLLANLLVGEIAELQARCQRAVQHRNIIAQQLLVAVREWQLLQSGSLEAAQQLEQEARRLADLIPEDRHAEWRYLAAVGELRIYRKQPASLSEVISQLHDLSADQGHWPGPLATGAELLHRASQAFGSDELGRRADEAWRSLVTRVVAGTEYRRQALGGRSKVFALEDVRQDLQSTLVFKPVPNRFSAEREVARIARVSQRIADVGMEGDFATPVALAIAEAADGQCMLILRRVNGTVLADLPIERQGELLEAVVTMLALCTPVSEEPGRTGWRPVKDLVSLGLRQMAPEHYQEVRERLRSCMPESPLVHRRDGNPGNWLVDEAGRIVAIDLEAFTPVPLGFDLAQLIEDGGMLPATLVGFRRRYSHMDRYSDLLGFGSGSWPAHATYDWCALSRAMWVTSYPGARRSHFNHGVELAHYLAEHASDRAIARLAQDLTAILPAAMSASAGKPRSISLSRKMSKALRHDNQLESHMDPYGWLALETLAEYLDQPAADLIAVVGHSEEKRFEMRNGEIRARYGHSISVEHEQVGGGTPRKLFHGTVWEKLDDIVRVGLLPMGRTSVHLSTDPEEALEVGRRRGIPVLLEVDPRQVEDLVKLAPAIWGAPVVAPHAITHVGPGVEGLLPLRHAVPAEASSR